MQGELDQESTTVPIQIVGVNYTSGANFNVDPQSGSCFFCNRDLPYLQDEAGQDVYQGFGAGKEDFIVVDGSGNIVYDGYLGSTNLQTPANFDSIKQLLIDFANAE